MARCYSRWSAVQRYDNPAGWVYKVGLNWARSKRRRSRRTPRFRTSGSVEQPPVADPAIHRALSELDVDLRAVVVCRYMFDWSVEATADALGIRPGTVKSRSHRALSKLQDELTHMR
jgi:RNA polymerase sigma-70 factor (ECF subfamily)